MRVEKKFREKIFVDVVRSKRNKGIMGAMKIAMMWMLIGLLAGFAFGLVAGAFREWLRLRRVRRFESLLEDQARLREAARDRYPGKVVRVETARDARFRAMRAPPEERVSDEDARLLSCGVVKPAPRPRPC